jgi:hypothetical protein
VGHLVLAEPYKPREIRFLEQWDLPGWRAKVYAITHPKRAMPDALAEEQVKKIIARRLAEVDPGQHYGVAVVIMHMARENDIISVTWWTWENVLQQALFVGPVGKPADLKDVTSTGLLACVWELEVHNFERCAWMQTVLRNSNGPDLERYLGEHLNTVI